ncbi:zinc-dependent alcohol dehydrogenase [Actinoplanes teichomyceticus]|uniref:D-arabinose 1-dehydrogenase-like Zn-dependent alcohol dehydrogenase n=1 Tax=Actinoplanes teichomyceticus TaxID=1867 RepID=A0A561VKZ2_ACTTI|nr:alcohol dehydrogenase catalytic domain-containing protein [Actinoplanes teichomyceticus]TWG12260.1 D-arabinose 1-dehydrogenase-like Zn-dependent alcohol dehydrogenase [Actinoplanes teichomyceticus]GIF14197.1 alcohol dehydrogenase [Actinoplanes teichomyceticus]
MRALVLTGPGEAEVRRVPEPQAGPGQVLVDVERVGVCGTDVELFTGEMSYLHTGAASYPLRPGHEWAGTVLATGPGVDRDWVGRRVTGDTMIGCGECARCRAGRHHVCPRRHELGCRDGLPGALAERLAFPAAYLHALPDAVDATLGALVEPGGNALRAVRAAAVAPGERLLVLGTGTIGLLAAMFGRALGARVHLLGEHEPTAELAGGPVWTRQTLPDLAWDAVVDATNAAALPGLAVRLVEPGRTVVYIGLAGAPSLVDTREIVLKDVTAVGILGASAGLAGAITAYAEGDADPRPLVAATVSLEQIVGVLAGERPRDAGPGPKFHVDPRR